MIENGALALVAGFVLGLIAIAIRGRFDRSLAAWVLSRFYLGPFGPRVFGYICGTWPSKIIPGGKKLRVYPGRGSTDRENRADVIVQDGRVVKNKFGATDE